MLQLVLAVGLLFGRVQSMFVTPAPVDSSSCHDTITVTIGSDFGSDCTHFVSSNTIDLLNGDYELACNDLISDPTCTDYETSDGHPIWYNINNDGNGCDTGNGGTFYALLVEVNDQLIIYSEYDDGNDCKQATFYFDGSLNDLFTTNPVGMWDFDALSDDCGFADSNDLCDGCAPDAVLDLTDCDGFGVQDSGGMSPPPSPGCETGWAKYYDDSKTLSFCDDGVFSNWGWTNYINLNTNTPAAGTTFEFEIWAGAGQCNTGNGQLAGYVTLSQVSGTQWDVTYSAQPGWTFNDVQVYLGDTRYPQLNSGSFTNAPGQFPYKNSANGDPSYVFNTDESDTNDGEFYFMAHTETCYDSSILLP